MFEVKVYRQSKRRIENGYFEDALKYIRPDKCFNVEKMEDIKMFDNEFCAVFNNGEILNVFGNNWELEDNDPKDIWEFWP